MADNQIDKIITNGDMSADPVPIATTDAPGIASFSPDDFLVTSEGEVQSLTKLGIAHVLTYVGSKDGFGLYEIITSFGKQSPKIGDVGLVLEDEVNGPIAETGSQVGTIVRFTSIPNIGEPEVYYAALPPLGSIAGPQGIRGLTGEHGETGAIHALVSVTVSTGTVKNQYGHPVSIYTYDGEIHEGDVVLVIESDDGVPTYGKPIYVGDVCTVTQIWNNTSFELSKKCSLRGPRGASIYTCNVVYFNGNINGSRFRWPISNNNLQDAQVGDIIISNTTGTYTFNYNTYTLNKGDVFKIISKNEYDTEFLTYATPDISVAKLQLGIYSVSEPVENENDITFKYVAPVGATPLVGGMALCTDDTYDSYFGKIYTITAVDTTAKTLTTEKVGADIRGPMQELEIGDVTTVPNDETGDAGQATATLTSADRIHNKLNLGIPVGPQGKQGIQGPEGPIGPSAISNLNARGNYIEGGTYYKNDLVFDNDWSWVCTAISTTEAPSEASNDWMKFTAAGAVGQVGPVGPAGADGKDGLIHGIGVDTMYGIIITASTVPIEIGHYVLISASDQFVPTYKKGDIIKITGTGSASGYFVGSVIMNITGPKGDKGKDGTDGSQLYRHNIRIEFSLGTNQLAYVYLTIISNLSVSYSIDSLWEFLDGNNYKNGSKMYPTVGVNASSNYYGISVDEGITGVICFHQYYVDGVTGSMFTLTSLWSLITIFDDIYPI